MINRSKKAFTMIELIFVIVILGILAAVAIPKLGATRDDAKASTKITNTKVCIDSAIAYYTATETNPDFTTIAPCSTAISDGVSLSIVEDNIVVSNSGLNSLDGSHRMKGHNVIH